MSAPEPSFEAPIGGAGIAPESKSALLRELPPALLTHAATFLAAGELLGLRAVCRGLRRVVVLDTLGTIAAPTVLSALAPWTNDTQRASCVACSDVLMLHERHDQWQRAPAAVRVSLRGLAATFAAAADAITRAPDDTNIAWAEALVSAPAHAADRMLATAVDAANCGVVLVRRGGLVATLLREWWALARTFVDEAAAEATAAPDAGVSGATLMVPLAGGFTLSAARHGAEAQLTREAAFELVLASHYDVYCRAGTDPAAVVAAALGALEHLANQAAPTVVGVDNSRRGGHGRGSRGGHRGGRHRGGGRGNSSVRIAGIECVAALGPAGLRHANGTVPFGDTIEDMTVVTMPAEVQLWCAAPTTDATVVVPGGVVTRLLAAEAPTRAVADCDAAVADAALAVEGALASDPIAARLPSELRTHGALCHAVNVVGAMPQLTRMPLNFLAASSAVAIDLTACTRLSVIGAFAFRDCSSLRTLALPPAVRRIGAHFCLNCVALERVSGNWAALARPIGPHAFNGCKSIAGWPTVPRSAEATPPAFAARIGDVTQHLDLRPLSKLRRIRKWFGQGSEFTAIAPLPASLRFIGRHFLNEASLLRIADLSGCGVVEIGSSCFVECRLLERVVLPASLRVIGDRFCFCCRALFAVDLTAVPRLTRVGRDFALTCTNSKPIVLCSQEVGNRIAAAQTGHYLPRLRLKIVNPTTGAVLEDSDNDGAEAAAAA